MAAQTPGKVLVVYYSLGGNTARMARDIATKTQGDIEVLRDRQHGAGFLGYVKAVVDALRGKPASLEGMVYEPRNYALTIIGTPVWAGRMTPAVRAYLQRFKADLPHVGFFVTSGKTPASTIVLPMEEILGHEADAFVGFDAAALGDPRICDERIAGFLQALHRPPAVPGSDVASVPC